MTKRKTKTARIITTKEKIQLSLFLLVFVLIGVFLIASAATDNFANPDGAKQYLVEKGYGNPIQVRTKPFEALGTPGCSTRRGGGNNIYKFVASYPEGNGSRHPFYVCRSFYSWTVYAPDGN